MTRQEPAGFDVDALYAALDAQRRRRGMSWPQVARAMGGISPSTLTGMRTRRALEGDGVLQMLRWLGRTPGSFVPGPATAPPDAALPPAPPAAALRFDTRALHAALDARRERRGLAWTQVAREIGGCSASSLTRLARGGRVSFPLVVGLARWLGRPVAAFTRVTVPR